MPPGFRLRNRYEIKDVLGIGGFGVTYAAQDMVLGRQVALKEYFPQDTFVARDQSGSITVAAGGSGYWTHDNFMKWMDRFIREGRILAQHNHANICKVYDIFQAHRTAYLVLEFLDGDTLEGRLDSGDSINEAQVELWGEQIIDALGSMHANRFYHLDISPANIFITARGDPILIDFGAAKPHRDVQTTMAHNPNYSPMELVSPTRTDIGAHTDIYEIAVVIHELLTGDLPPHWADFTPEWDPRVPNRWKALLKAALQPSPQKRPSDIEAWWNMLRHSQEAGKRPVDRLGNLTAAAAKDDENAVSQIAEITGYTEKFVKSQLLHAAGTTRVKNQFKKKWPRAEASVHRLEVGTMTCAAVRDDTAWVEEIAAITGYSEKFVRQQLKAAKGNVMVKNQFKNKWPK